MSTINVSIEGMTCPSCVYKVECEVSDLNGVTEAKVDLANKRGTFTFDSNLISADDIIKKINELGFKANLAVISFETKNYQIYF